MEVAATDASCPPKPPQLLTMNDTGKALYSQLNAIL